MATDILRGSGREVVEKKEKGLRFDAQTLPASALHLADEADDLAPKPGGVESTQVVPIQCHHASCGVIEALQQGSHCGLSWRKGKLEVWGEKRGFWRLSQQRGTLVAWRIPIPDRSRN